jgi:hypothetical protein
MWKCPKCETNNEGDFCIICGSAKLSAVDSPKPSNPFYVPDLGEDRTRTYLAAAPGKPGGPEVCDDAPEGFIPDLLTRIRISRVFVVVCTIAVIILMAIPYMGDHTTIFSLIAGEMPDGSSNGVIQAVSIVLLAMTLLPMIFIWFNYGSRKRYLPVTVSIISFSVTAIYCLTLGIGMLENGLQVGVFVWLAPMLMSAVILLCAVCLKWQKQIDNILKKPFMVPDSSVEPAGPPERTAPPTAASAPIKQESVLKNTMRNKHDELPKGES